MTSISTMNGTYEDDLTVTIEAVDAKAPGADQLTIDLRRPLELVEREAELFLQNRGSRHLRVVCVEMPRSVEDLLSRHRITLAEVHRWAQYVVQYGWALEDRLAHFLDPTNLTVGPNGRVTSTEVEAVAV